MNYRYSLDLILNLILNYCDSLMGSEYAHQTCHIIFDQFQTLLVNFIHIMEQIILKGA